MKVWVVMGNDSDSRYSGPEAIYSNMRAAQIHRTAIGGFMAPMEVRDNAPEWIKHHMPDVIKEVDKGLRGPGRSSRT